MELELTNESRPSDSPGILAPQGIGPDLLKGAVEIALFLGCTSRQVYRLYDLAKGHKSDIPLTKIRGFGLTASRHELQVWFRRQVGPHRPG